MVKPNRISATFEQLRRTVESITPRPECFVVNIGSVVKNKPRVDFALSVFEPVGFITNTNEGFKDAQAAIDFILRTEQPYFVISSTDDQYPEIVPQIAKTVKAQAPEKILVLAGYPKEHLESFTAAGIDFYIYMRCNIVSTIQEILKKAGVKI